MDLSKRMKMAIAGLTGIATLGGVSQMKDNEVNTQGLDEPTSANHIIDQADNKHMSVEGAIFNLDTDNPEIIVDNQKEETIGSLAHELQRAIAHNMDYEDIMEMSADERAQVVAQIAKDYRACEKSMEMTGEIDPELVGENNYCSKYFDPEGDKFHQKSAVQDIQALATIVMTEEYAKHVDGLPKNGQQQQMYDKLGEEFSKLYQAHRHVSQETMVNHLQNAHSFMKNEIGDISYLSGEAEMASAQEKIDEAKKLYLEKVTADLDAQDLDDISYVQQKEAAKDAMFLLGDTERYQKYYEVDPAEVLKYQELEEVYENKVDFARSIRLVAGKLGVDDQITMQYDTINDTLNIDANNLNNNFELDDDEMSL